MPATSTIEASAEADLDLSAQIIQALSDMLASGGFWLIIALLATLVVMQGIKSVLKTTIPPKYKKHRKWVTFIIAYIVGFQCGLYFLEGEDVHKWAVVIGLINPMVYFAVLQVAIAKNWMVIQSVLKMRPLLVQGDGSVKLDDTQAFKVS